MLTLHLGKREEGREGRERERGEGRVGKGGRQGWEDAINNRMLSAVLDVVSEMETMSHECMPCFDNTMVIKLNKGNWGFDCWGFRVN